MPSKKGDYWTARSSKGNPKPGGGGNQTWCHGDIWFTSEGCLYIKDSSLAAAIDTEVGKNGGFICISYEDPNSNGNWVNVLCSC